MELSVRLKAVADSVCPARCCADIGCDHGFLSIYLVENGICERMIAMDVNAGPLKRASEHTEERNFADIIDIRLSDGFQALEEGEAQEAVIAGMGGPLGLRILYEGREKVCMMERIVLQLQSEPAVVRYVLKEWGFKTENEVIVEEDSKFYTVLTLTPPEKFKSDITTVKDSYVSDIKNSLKDKDLRTLARLTYGRILLERADECISRFLSKEEDRLGEIYECLGAKNSFTNRERMQELEKDIEVLMYAERIVASSQMGSSDD